MELLIVLVILYLIAAMAIPQVQRLIYDIKLRSSAGDLAGLIQQDRIKSAKDNNTYPVRFTNTGGASVAYIDLNNNSALDGAPNQEPVIPFGGTVVPAPAAPNGVGGQPSPYSYPGDTSLNPPFDNATTLAFSPRGLPCNYNTPPTCQTPAPSYFVYYLTDGRPGSVKGWAAVMVTKSGRTRVLRWNGKIWN